MIPLESPSGFACQKKLPWRCTVTTDAELRLIRAYGCQPTNLY